MTLFLSRLTLRRNPSADALKYLLQPKSVDRISSDHNLVWSAFADGPNRTRDFLWRSEGKGVYFTLSYRPPNAEAAGIFEPAESREFSPQLRRGSQLDFILRVNATKDLSAPPRSGGKRRSKRVDVVMHAIHKIPRHEGRGAARQEVLKPVAADWMVGQAAKNGFSIDEDALRVNGYTQHHLPGATRHARRQFGVLDLAGRLTVDDPDAFLARIGVGFGRAKAFGCGLMMIRRTA